MRAGTSARKKTLNFYSLYGLVEVSERIWRTPQKSYLRRLPSALSITHRGYTQPLQRVLTDFGLDHSFATATAKVKEHHGFDIPVSSLRNYSVRNAQRIAKEADIKLRSGNSLPAQGVNSIVAEADGSMVAMVHFDGRSKDQRKNRQVAYHEVRLCACHATGTDRTMYRADIGTPERIGQIWNDCAKQAGRGLNTFVHAVGDGATWIEQQARSQLGCDRFLLDFYHVCEYLKAAEPACKPNKRWFTTQKKRLLSNRSDRVLNELTRHLEHPQQPDEEAPVRRAHRYLSNRPDSIDYQNSQNQSFPIGSGLIESAHKHVIQARMKIAGAAWLQPTAEAFIQTRAHRASEKWDCFWQN